MIETTQICGMDAKLIRVDCIRAKECKHPEAHACYECGDCGRIFEQGFMVDDGGTTLEEEDE